MLTRGLIFLCYNGDMERSELNKKTKQRLYDMAIDYGITDVKMTMLKKEMVDTIYEKLTEQQQRKEQAEDQVAVELFHNVYDPKAGRLTKGIHLMPYARAQRLLTKLSSATVKRLTPQEVAAHYGLSDGNTTR